MLRITDSRSSQGAKAYFKEGLKRADYYMDGEETTATWSGSAARKLGLTVGAPVEEKQFMYLLDGLHPVTGEKLTARMRANRRPGIDLTFSAPKAVSLVQALNGDRRIDEVFDKAVHVAMAQVEADMKTRVRSKGRDEDRITGNIVWAGFTHKTARPVNGVPDPHWHQHCYIPNITFDAIEDRWKATQTGDIKADGNYYEAIFLNELASGMRELGYPLTRKGKWWTIEGIDQSFSDRFSRRTAQVEDRAKMLGLVTGDQKTGLGATTREKKQKAISAHELSELWQARLMPADQMALDKLKATATSSDGNGTSSFVGAARGAATFAIDKLLAKQSAVPTRMMIAEALNMSMGTASSDDIKTALDQTDLVHGQVDGRPMVTTKQVIQEEQDVLRFAREGRGTQARLNAAHIIKDERLNKGQRGAIDHILSSRDKLILLRGGAGTGKTTLMQEAVRGIEKGGTSVQVLAPTSAACKVLRDDGFANAETLQLLLAKGGLPAAGKGAVVWVDEAGLISVPQMKQLSELAKTNDWRLVLSGDSRQHGPVERGDAMRLLETKARLPLAEVSDIMRQRGDYKKAVATIAAGHIHQGWQRLEAMGAVLEVEPEKKAERLAADYIGERDAGKSVIVVAPTHREKDAVTNKVRDALKSLGTIDQSKTQNWSVLRDLRMEDAEKGDASRFTAGQTVELKQNAKGLIRGTRLTITAQDKDGQLIACDHNAKRHVLPLDQPDRFKVYGNVNKEFAPGDLIRITENTMSKNGQKLENGSIFSIKRFTRSGDMLLDNGARLGKDHGHIDHGICTTSHSSQGRTVDTVLISLGSESERAISREQFYVSVSRGRDHVRIYTDDKAAVSEATKRSSARISASELRLDGKQAYSQTIDERYQDWQQWHISGVGKGRSQTDIEAVVAKAALEGRLGRTDGEIAQ